MTTVKSTLSGAPAELAFSTQVLGKYKADIYRDSTIPFVFVNNPTWLAEAYSDELPSLDTGMLMRNVSLADRVTLILNQPQLSSQLRNGIDLGGGYGIFVRAMRDRGHDFYWSDPHTRNLAAKGFEANEGRYDVATAFEVMEHTPFPLEFVKAAIDRVKPKVFLFSTECFSPEQTPPQDWSYWSFETGQHISFFTVPALQHIADAIGYRFVDLGGSLFAFSQIEIPFPRAPLLSRLVAKTQRLALKAGLSQPPKSLMMADFELVRKLLRAKQDTQDAAQGPGIGLGEDRR